LGEVIDYDFVCRIARFRARSLPPSIDWRDLAQEAAVCILAGRKSITGPMIDYLRHQGMTGRRQPQCKRLPATVLDALPARERGDFLMAGVSSAVVKLRPRQREVIMAHYWRDELIVDIARRLGVDDSRVSQIHREALAAIRRQIGLAA
jgi:RNA polymerase sigma factor (sigma-70 family)